MARGVTVRRLLLTVTWLLTPAWFTAPATAQWAQFRGPAAGAVADDPRLPDHWSETDNVAWKIQIPGLGWSSPIVWDDLILVTSAISAGQERPPVSGLYDPGTDNGAQQTTAVHRFTEFEFANDEPSDSGRLQRASCPGYPVRRDSTARPCERLLCD